MERSAKKHEDVVALGGAFPESEDTYRTWLHEPFLERIADQRFRERAAYTLGAFLVMRLVDRYAVGAGYTDPESLAYQESSALEYVSKLDQEDAEAGHLMELIRVSNQVRVRGSRKLLWAPLLAYAYWLEQELRLKEALDVVETALRMGDGTAPQEEVSALLQRAYILRLLGRLDLARASYHGARCRAESAGDRHAVLLSRIGEANVLRQLGNLPGSEQALRDVLKEAEELGDKDAQARAHHDLGLVMSYRQLHSHGLYHLYRAYELYPDESNKMRALSDVGEALKELGEIEGARTALSAVLGSKSSPQTCAYAVIGLLEIARISKDRASFAWWAQRAALMKPDLPADLSLELDLQIGIGRASFGAKQLAFSILRDGLSRTEALGLGQYIFRFEQALKELEAQSNEGTAKPAPRRSRADERIIESVVRKIQGIGALRP